LPKAPAGNNASVTRDHSLVEHHTGNCPVITLVGGKLTTWREFAHQVSDRVLTTLAVSRTENCSSRFVPVSNEPKFPTTESQRDELWQAWSEEFNAPIPLIAALWPLYGLRTADILAACEHHHEAPIHGTDFTPEVVRWIAAHEWVRTLSDLVERRLMLVFARALTRQTLEDLADILIAAGVLPAAYRSREIESTIDRLTTYYGRRI
jgi:glycerol-3-phosphate dehydrogenase